MPHAGSQMVSPGFGTHHVHDGANEGAGREVLARAALGVLGVLLQEPLVCIALHVGVEARPLLPVDEVGDEPSELRRVLNLVLGLPEDDPEHPLRLAERLQGLPVVDLQGVAIL